MTNILADSHVTVVTAKTGGWDTLEDCSRMTSLARYSCVCALQRKCCELVFEIQIDFYCVWQSLPQRRFASTKSQHDQSHDGSQCRANPGP